MHPVWKKGGGASFEGGESNDYFTEVEILQNEMVQFTSIRMLRTGDPYDFPIEYDKEIDMAFTIIYNQQEQLGSFKMKLEEIPGSETEFVEANENEIEPFNLE